jgi:hypothetical protein
MALSQTPLSGRYPFVSVQELSQRLARVAHLFPKSVHQSAYLLTQDGQGSYGMDQAALFQAVEKQGANVHSLAAWVCQTNGEGVWVRVRFAGEGQTKARFLIATQDVLLGSRLRGVLLGESTRGIAAREAEIRVPISSSAEDRASTHWREVPPTATARTYAQATLRIADGFYFPPQLSFEALAALTEQLSAQYLKGASFYLQLETSDGDFYRDLEPQELRYFFHRRREKLWLLYLEANAADGQSLYIRFWFHPLLSGPNALVYLTSHQAEEMLGTIHDHLSISAPLPPQALSLHQSYQIPEDQFHLPALIDFLNQQARTYLHGIPAIAFMGTHTGLSYTGLSMYQLRQLYPLHAAAVGVLSLGVNRIVTGQSISLMFQFDPQGGNIRVHLSMMWGEEAIHRGFRNALENHFGVSPELISGQVQVETTGIPQRGMVSLPSDRGLAEKIWHEIREVGRVRGISYTSLRPAEAHKAWEEMLVGLLHADHWILDLSDRHPERWFYLGVARSLGKQVILLIQEPELPPPAYLSYPCIRYTLDESGKILLQKALNQVLDQFIEN